MTVRCPRSLGYPCPSYVRVTRSFCCYYNVSPEIKDSCSDLIGHPIICEETPFWRVRRRVSPCEWPSSVRGLVVRVPCVPEGGCDASQVGYGGTGRSPNSPFPKCQKHESERDWNHWTWDPFVPFPGTHSGPMSRHQKKKVLVNKLKGVLKITMNCKVKYPHGSKWVRE